MIKNNKANSSVIIGFIFIFVVLLFILIINYTYADTMKNRVEEYDNSINTSFVYYEQETKGKNFTNSEKYQTIEMVCDLYSTFPSWCRRDLSEKIGIVK